MAKACSVCCTEPGYDRANWPLKPEERAVLDRIGDELPALKLAFDSNPLCARCLNHYVTICSTGSDLIRLIEPYLGKKPDNQIAKQFDVTREYIRQLRVARGIPKFKK